MASNIFSISGIALVLVLVSFLWTTVVGGSHFQTFNVADYGAIADGRTDNSQAFLKAWNDACQSRGKSRVQVNVGSYMLHAVVFAGPCKGQVWFDINGKLVAPTDPSLFSGDTWIRFYRVDGLHLGGGGILDGQGASAWKYNDCATNPHCMPLPSSLNLAFVTNSSIRRLVSINSKNIHVNLFGCDNVEISLLELFAPTDSPNTDGIHIGNSNNIKIFNSQIGTGDDCISMVAGSRNIDINGVQCGPGHGISIGSLGKPPHNDNVQGITVSNTNISNTQNGVRIKTWSPSPPTLATDIVFQNIRMFNVCNPIFIDQQYCPSCRKLPPLSVSRVQIKNVTYSNIWGTSNSKVAVSLQCSSVVPCTDVKINNIDLRYIGPGGQATTSCSYVHGTASGKMSPPACL